MERYLSFIILSAIGIYVTIKLSSFFEKRINEESSYKTDFLVTMTIFSTNFFSITAFIMSARLIIYLFSLIR